MDSTFEGGDSDLQKWLVTADQPRWKVVVLAVLVVLLFALMLFVAGGFAAWNSALKAKLSSPERFGNQSENVPNNNYKGIYTSSPGAGGWNTDSSQILIPNNASVINTTVGGSMERLTATNSAPDFWTVSDELGRSQDSDRVGRGDLGENQYWSPDLQLWLTSSEVKQLPADQAAKVQYYGNQAVGPAGQQQAAVERMRAVSNKLLLEQMRGNSNANLSPEERMMSDMLAPEYRAEHMITPREVQDSLMSRLGSGM